MCAACESKAEKLRALAAEFRRNAAKTRIPRFIEMMTRTALNLETFADSVSRGCSHARSPRDAQLATRASGDFPSPDPR